MQIFKQFFKFAYDVSRLVCARLDKMLYFDKVEI